MTGFRQAQTETYPPGDAARLRCGCSCAAQAEVRRCSVLPCCRRDLRYTSQPRARARRMAVASRVLPAIPQPPASSPVWPTRAGSRPTETGQRRVDVAIVLVRVAAAVHPPAAATNEDRFRRAVSGPRKYAEPHLRIAPAPACFAGDPTGDIVEVRGGCGSRRLEMRIVRSSGGFGHERLLGTRGFDPGADRDDADMALRTERM